MSVIRRGCLVVLGLMYLGLSPGLVGAQQSVYASKKALEYRLEGYRHQQQGDLDSAIVYYRKAIDEDVAYATAHNDLGIVYEQKGMYEAAERSYLRAIKKDDSYKGAYSNLAYLYENKGDINKAVYYWKHRLLLEGSELSKWSDKAREKINELQQRRKIRETMTEDEQRKYKNLRYEKKKKAKFNGWTPDTNPDKVEKEIGERYFDKGLELYNQHRYDEAMASFRMARNHNVHEKDVNRYVVKINKIKEALAKSDIVGDKVYANIVSKEDLMLAKDHFKMGLDYFSQQDYERAFSSFTMAMTYNPYDEVIQKYVEDSKIKIQEEKVRREKLREDAVRSNAAKMREPADIRRDMVEIKSDMINKGFVTTSEDMSVESFLNDGKELCLRKRYEDALYVWKQAMLLDVSGLYTEELQSLIDQADIESTKAQESRLDSLANVTEEELLADVTRAAIPSAKEGAPSWALRSRRKVAKAMKESSPDKQVILQKLETRYTLNFKDASLKGVVDLLAELTGLNIVIDTKEIEADALNQGNITFKVKDMPLIQIIEAVLRFTDFDYLIEDNLIWITTKNKIRKEDIILVVYDVQDIIGKIFDFPAEELGSGFSRREGSVGPTSDSESSIL